MMTKTKEIENMLIHITEINDAKLGQFDAKQIEGTRIDNGEAWGKKFFANNRKLADELSEFGVGDNVNVKMVQEGKHWNIAGFTEVSEAMIEKVRAGGGGYKAGNATATPAGNGGSSKAASTGGAKSDSMSKEEWAEKDRLTNIRIAKAVALKGAIDNTKVGTKAKDLMAMADTLLPYLLNTKVPTKKEDTKESPFVDTDGDGLTPPAV